MKYHHPKCQRFIPTKIRKGVRLLYLMCSAVFSLSRFFSVNQQFVGTGQIILAKWYSFREFNNFVEIWHLVYLNTGTELVLN